MDLTRLRPLLVRHAAAAAIVALLLAGAAWPHSPAPLQVLVAAAVLAAYGLAGRRAARALLPTAGAASFTTAAFTAGSALALVPAVWLGHFGLLTPGWFLLWTALVVLAVAALPAARPEAPTAASAPSAPESAPESTPDSRGRRLERALLLAVAAVLVLVALKFVWSMRWVPPGRGPDEDSYHLTAVAVWQRFADLRMVKFAMGDPGTTFYPVLGELASWCLLAPFRDNDVLARWSQLPFALASLAALAAILRRLGVSRAATGLGVVFYAGIRHAIPELALSAGNDHSASFYTLAAVDAALCLGASGGRRRGPALYLGGALGLLLGTKYIGILFAPVVVAVAAVALFDRAGTGTPAPSHRPRLLTLLACCAAALAATGGYTYLRNALVAGNPLFPLPLTVLGRTLLEGLPGTSVLDRSGAPEFAIDVWSFLTRRADAFGNLFPLTLLPAAMVAPLLALGRRRYRAAAVLALPAVFFAQFLWLMHDHRDMRYFLPGVALAAAALAWVVDGERPWLRAVRQLLLAALLVDRVGSLHGAQRGLAIAVALAAIAWVMRPPSMRGRFAVTRRPGSTGALVAVSIGAVIAAAVGLGAVAEHYQSTKLAAKPAALALDRLTLEHGTTVAYAGYNTPYLYFGSRLQNTVHIVPRNGRVEQEYFAWGGSARFPYEATTYRRWRRNLAELGARYLVIVRSPAEEPERSWVLRHPADFRPVYGDAENEVWAIAERD